VIALKTAHISSSINLYLRNLQNRENTPVLIRIAGATQADVTWANELATPSVDCPYYLAAKCKWRSQDVVGRSGIAGWCWEAMVSPQKSGDWSSPA
jgi:hypothetical protein